MYWSPIINVLAPCMAPGLGPGPRARARPLAPLGPCFFTKNAVCMCPPVASQSQPLEEHLLLHIVRHLGVVLALSKSENKTAYMQSILSHWQKFKQAF